MNIQLVMLNLKFIVVERRVDVIVRQALGHYRA